MVESWEFESFETLFIDACLVLKRGITNCNCCRFTYSHPQHGGYSGRDGHTGSMAGSSSEHPFSFMRPGANPSLHIPAYPDSSSNTSSCNSSTPSSPAVMVTSGGPTPPHSASIYQVRFFFALKNFKTWSIVNTSFVLILKKFQFLFRRVGL